MIASVSVDLDGLGCYAAIHGLDPAVLDDAALRAVPEVAVSRLCALFAGLGVPATFFVIGRELSISTAGIKAAFAAGHEIASHSFAHDYALSRLPAADIARDLELAEEAIFSAVGARPRGFRAPGYTLSRALLEVIAARGYAYDSSLLPSPPYYALKAAAMGLLAARGRRSHSILGAPAQLFAARRPHLRHGVRELPVATLPLLRLPVIGTVALGVAPFLGALLSRGAFAGGHFNLELHGIDLLDASDVPPRIAAAQPGLQMPVGEKVRRLRELLRSLPGEGCSLEDAARRLLP